MQVALRERRFATAFLLSLAVCVSLALAACGKNDSGSANGSTAGNATSGAPAGGPPQSSARRVADQAKQDSQNP